MIRRRPDGKRTQTLRKLGITLHQRGHALRKRGRKLRARVLELRRRAEGLDPVIRGMLWSVAAGITFALLNAILRVMTTELDPMQAQFLRYLFGLIVMLPIILRQGLIRYRPNGIAGQLWRGVIHTSGLMLWFTALPHLSLAYMTAIGFTTPIFIMLGAAIFFREKMVPARWFAAILGFGGVLVVVGPRLAGGDLWYALVMLGSAPLFAGSFLITKALTRRDSPAVIVVWQSIVVAAFSLPLALMSWTDPSPAQWAWFAVSGVLGSAGHYCLTRSFACADISATQPVRFLDLVWASVLGFLVFADVPALSTLLGGSIILASTVWIARRESRARHSIPPE
ncbi:MAG: DMT family transporter [Burkholderiaceae bacterium]|nr:DMT family transporter [Burkholderiaceae bacterium]